MSSDQLSEAIQMIQQGQDAQAQPILQALIRANPQDLAAWSWFVKTCRTPEKRLNALEICLKFNPDNPQILEAVQKLREKLTPPPPMPTPDLSLWDTPPSLLEPEADASPWNTPASLLEPQSSAFEMYTPSSFRNPELDAVPGYTPPPQPETPYIPYIPPTSLTARETPTNPDDEYKGLDHWRGRPFIWYDVWLRALTQPTQESYTALLRDPLASQKRVYGWTIVSNLVTWLILVITLVAMVNPTLTEFLAEYGREYGIGISTMQNFEMLLGIILLALVPVQTVASLINLILTGAIYAFVAAFVGGSGNYSRIVYLLGAWQAPYNILIGILIAILVLVKVSFVSVIVGTLIFGVLLYSIWLNLASLSTAHNLKWEKSCIVIVVGAILSTILSCLFQIMLDGVLKLVE